MQKAKASKYLISDLNAYAFPNKAFTACLVARIGDKKEVSKAPLHKKYFSPTLNVNPTKRVTR